MYVFGSHSYTRCKKKIYVMYFYSYHAFTAIPLLGEYYYYYYTEQNLKDSVNKPGQNQKDPVKKPEQNLKDSMMTPEQNYPTSTHYP